MAAGTIRMTPQELRAGATYLDGQLQEAMGCLQSMKSKVDEVNANWEGAADTAFMQTFEELYNQISQALPQTVEGIENMLNGAAQGLEEADSQIASSLRM